MYITLSEVAIEHHLLDSTTMAWEEAYHAVMNFHLVLEFVNDVAGIYEPTPAFLEFVSQSIKDAKSAHRLFKSDLIRIARADSPVAKDSNTNVAIFYSDLRRSTQNFVKPSGKISANSFSRFGRYK